jgi:hypothetical protein
MSDLLAPNIQIYDARVVDLYQWVCAQYLVGVKGAETKAKRSWARLSITLVPQAAVLLTRKDGGHDRDRTCDPYHVKVVRDTNSRVKSKRKDR